MLLNLHDGLVPADRAKLEARLVGRKTANVVLNEAFGQPTIAVDTHISGSATAPEWHRERRRCSRS